MTDLARSADNNADQQDRASTGGPSTLDRLVGDVTDFNTLFALATGPTMARAVGRYFSLGGEFGVAKGYELATGASREGASFERNAQIAEVLFREKGVEGLVTGGWESLGMGSKLDTGLGPLGIAGDVVTLAKPDQGQSVAVQNTERVIAGVNIAGTAASMVAVNVAADWVPVVGQVVAVGTGLYLTGDYYFYTHSPEFHHFVDASAEDVRSVADSAASTAVRGAKDFLSRLDGGAKLEENIARRGMDAVGSAVSNGASAFARWVGL